MNLMKTKNRLSTVEKTAYHEAGHAIGCYLMGFEIEYATIIPDDDCAGQVKSNEFENYFHEGFRLYHIKDYELIFNSIVVNLAGYYCVRKVAGKGKLFVDFGDYGRTLDLLDSFNISPDLRDSMMATAEYFLRDILNQERPWQLVRIIAESLLERKTLSGKEILEIIENSNYHILRKTRSSTGR